MEIGALLAKVITMAEGLQAASGPLGTGKEEGMDR